MLKKIVFFLTLSLLALSPTLVSARDSADITDWYIKDFKSRIVINPDSSISVTEYITADCGNLPDKHGIFRVLPTAIRTTDKGRIRMPIELISITNFSNEPLNYETITKPLDSTVTWKIGDPNQTVQGVNEYKIEYRVANAIRAQKGFNELYWNLNGNFWDLETDAYQADIVIPSGIKKDQIKIDYYVGQSGSKEKTGANFFWVDDRTIRFASDRVLRAQEGLTVSLSMPAGIISPYKKTLSDYAAEGYVWPLLPILVFVVGFSLWRKYGDDPDLKRTVIPEYEAPDNLGPMEMGLIWKNGGFENRFITAGVIKLASAGLIEITEEKNKILFASWKEYSLRRTEKPEILKTLSPAELSLYSALFAKGEIVSLSDLKKDFYKSWPQIKSSAHAWAVENDYLDRSSFKYQLILLFGGAGFLILLFMLVRNWLSIPMIIAFVLSAAVILFFTVFMPKKTLKGAEAEWKIKGFRLYMNTAEKYRQRFHEQENIFLALLPYAIAFDLTKKWIEKMRAIYGDERFTALAPAWFISSSGGSFDADSFSSALNSLSSSIASSVSPSSGAGGGGASGGGGGGGGGGGW